MRRSAVLRQAAHRLAAQRNTIPMPRRRSRRRPDAPPSMSPPAGWRRPPCPMRPDSSDIRPTRRRRRSVHNATVSRCPAARRRTPPSQAENPSAPTPRRRSAVRGGRRSSCLSRLPPPHLRRPIRPTPARFHNGRRLLLPAAPSRRPDLRLSPRPESPPIPYILHGSIADRSATATTPPPIFRQRYSTAAQEDTASLPFSSSPRTLPECPAPPLRRCCCSGHGRTRRATPRAHPCRSFHSVPSRRSASTRRPSRRPRRLSPVRPPSGPAPSTTAPPPASHM